MPKKGLAEHIKYGFMTCKLIDILKKTSVLKPNSMRCNRLLVDTIILVQWQIEVALTAFENFIMETFG